MDRKAIAVVTSKADSDEQRKLIEGVVERARILDIDVIVFSNLFEYNSFDKMLTYENVIYDYFEPKLFDGIIVSGEAFFDKAIYRSVCDKVKESGVPAVMIDGWEDGFISVESDEDANFDEIVKHLVIHHGIKNIDILNGPKDESIPIRRLAAIKKAFAKYGVPFDENKVFNGTFWYLNGENLAEKYAKKEVPMPEAVICTNDYMAFGLCNSLTKFGIKVPDDISVMGYDYMGERIYNYPILTTFESGRKKRGSDAVDLLFPNDIEKSKGNMQLILGDSCKCGADVKLLMNELALIKELRYHQNLISESPFGSKLTACRSIKEYTNVIQDNFNLLQGASALYFCSKKHNEVDKYICSQITGQRVSNPVEISEGNLLSELLRRRKGWGVYYLSPLTFQMSLLGFTALHYNYVRTYNKSFHDWNRTASNALEMLRMKNNISYLKQCQSVSEMYDSMTGFYNFDEFINLIREVKEFRKLRECKLLSVKLNFLADEEFSRGGNYKSEIISNVANAIKQACFKHEVYSRISETHFIILSEETKSMFADRIKSFVEYEVRSKNYDSKIDVNFYEYVGEIESNTLQEFKEKAEHISNIKLDEAHRKIDSPRFNELCQIRMRMYAMPQVPMDIEDACKTLCVSEGYFRAIYKDAFDVSYLQDLINAKVLYAKYLLCTTSMSIYAVAKKCGYNDEKYFARQFGKSANCSPAQYRSDTFSTNY